MLRRGKILSLILTVGMLSANIYGCSSSNNATEDGVAKITVWTQEGQVVEQEYYKNAIEQFNELYAGEIEASLQMIPRGNGYEYENKINAAATSGSLPDIIAMDGPSVANYADSGIIVPIDEYFTEDKLEDFVPSIIKQGTVDGQLYALGAAESTVVLFYNKDVLDAGIQAPTTLEDAWTWKEVYEISKKLKTNDMYGINLDWDLGEGQIYAFAPMIWSNGGELLSEDGKKIDGYLNSDKSIEALEFYQKFAVEGLINLQPLPNDFEEGKSAMYLMGSWEIQTIEESYPDFNYGITYYPKFSESSKVVSPSGDWCFGITSGSENQEAAAKLLEFLTSAEEVEEYCSAISKPPARISVFDNMEEYQDENKKVIKEQVINTAHPRPISTSYPVLSSEFASALQDIRTGVDVKDALAKVVTRFNEDIKRNN